MRREGGGTEKLLTVPLTVSSCSSNLLGSCKCDEQADICLGKKPKVLQREEVS